MEEVLSKFIPDFHLENMERDKEVNAKLQAEGWTVLRFWGKDIKKHLTECADKIEQAVKGNE